VLLPIAGNANVVELEHSSLFASLVLERPDLLVGVRRTRNRIIGPRLLDGMCNTNHGVASVGSIEGCRHGIVGIVAPVEHGVLHRLSKGFLVELNLARIVVIAQVRPLVRANMVDCACRTLASKCRGLAAVGHGWLVSQASTPPIYQAHTPQSTPLLRARPTKEHVQSSLHTNPTGPGSRNLRGNSGSTSGTRPVRLNRAVPAHTALGIHSSFHVTRVPLYGNRVQGSTQEPYRKWVTEPYRARLSREATHPLSHPLDPVLGLRENPYPK